MELPDAISQARTNAKLGLNEAARLLDTYGATLSRMEAGTTGIKAAMLVKMADLYKVSIDHLVRGEVVRQPSTIDLDMMGAVVRTIAEHVQSRRLTPTPIKLSKAVVQVYRAEVSYLLDHPKAEFDLQRHESLIDALFEE